MEKQPEFRDYCADQIERLGGAFPEMRFYKRGAIEELVNWIEAKAAGDEAKAAGVITEACELSEIPKIADLNAIWTRLYVAPGIVIASPDCQYCSGSGFEIIERRGIEAARKCRCGGTAPGGLMGSTPANRESLQRENSKFAAELAQEMRVAQQRPARPLPPLPNAITEADIARAKGGL